MPNDSDTHERIALKNYGIIFDAKQHLKRTCAFLIFTEAHNLIRPHKLFESLCDRCRPGISAPPRLHLAILTVSARFFVALHHTATPRRAIVRSEAEADMCTTNGKKRGKSRVIAWGMIRFRLTFMKMRFFMVEPRVEPPCRPGDG